MADLVARASATIALCAIVVGGSACGGAEPAKSPLASVDAAAAYAETIYRDLDAAAGEAYVLRALATGSQSIGESEPCVAADNRPSRRPSALANPPYTEASIAQRSRLIRALGAFAILKTAVAHAKTVADVAPELANFQAMAFEANVSANVHAQGDLFVDEDAAGLVRLGEQLRGAATPDRIEAFEIADAPVIDKLVAIVRADVERSRVQAIGALRNDAALALSRTAANVPACDEPIATATASAIAPAREASVAPLLRDARARSLAHLAQLDALSLDDFFDDLRAIADTAPTVSGALDRALEDLDTATLTPRPRAES